MLDTPCIHAVCSEQKDGTLLLAWECQESQGVGSLRPTTSSSPEMPDKTEGRISHSSAPGFRSLPSYSQKGHKNEAGGSWGLKLQVEILCERKVSGTMQKTQLLHHVCFENRCLALPSIRTVCVSHSYPTVCDPMDCRPQAPLSVGSARQEYWGRVPLPPPHAHHAHSESLDLTLNLPAHPTDVCGTSSG